MTYAVVIGVVLLSLTSIPVHFALSKMDLRKNSEYILGAMVICTIVVVGSSALLFRRFFKRVDPAMYVFSLMSFTGVCSLMLALEMDGRISKLLGFYILDGEQYLKTGHGVMVAYYEGTVHTLLCIVAIALYFHRESHREVALFWAGSLLNVVFVLVPGAFAGPHQVKAPMICNIINFGAPFFIAVWYLHRSPIQARSFITFPPIWRRPVDLLFVVFFKLAALVALFRLLTVLGGNPSCMKDYLKNYDPYLKDANMFPKIQTLTYGYFFLAYYCVTIYGLICPGQHWMSDWAFIHAGAAAVAQVTYVGGSLHGFTSKGLHPPTSGQAAYIFWTINILLFVVPQLFAFWCHRDPEKYGRTYTVDLAQPLKTYVKHVKHVHVTTSISPRKSDYFSQKTD